MSILCRHGQHVTANLPGLFRHDFPRGAEGDTNVRMRSISQRHRVSPPFEGAFSPPLRCPEREAAPNRAPSVTEFTANITINVRICGIFRMFFHIFYKKTCSLFRKSPYEECGKGCMQYGGQRGKAVLPCRITTLPGRLNVR